MLKKYNKKISIHPDIFIKKKQKEEDSDKLLQDINVIKYEYEV